MFGYIDFKKLDEENCGIKIMKKVVFSVIMPCYNSQNYVRNAIESVLNQTYSEVELIIINDGSKDDTLRIVESYAKKDDRIKIYSKENGGYSSAVNMGLDHISGDYFCFLGSDDTLDLQLFQCVYENLCNVGHLVDSIAFRTVQIIDGEEKGNDYCTNFSEICYSQNTNFKRYIDEYPKHARIFSERDTSKIFKTDLLKNLRYFGKYGVTADGVFSMLLSHRSSSFLSIPHDGYFWTLRSDSVSASLSVEKRVDSIENWRKFFDIILTFKIDEITSQEKKYIGYAAGEVSDLSMGIKYSVKYHHFLRDNAKAFKKTLEIFDYSNSKMINNMSMVAFSPVVYSLVEKIKRFFHRVFK